MEVIATKHRQLGYCFTPPYFWRIIDLATQQPVGPRYSTQSELLADLDRYAGHFTMCRHCAGKTQAPAVQTPAATPVGQAEKTSVPANTTETRRTVKELIAMVNANFAGGLTTGDANYA
jgi:hypothetical protein